MGFSKCHLSFLMRPFLMRPLHRFLALALPMGVLLFASLSFNANANTYDLTAPNRPAICSGSQGTWSGNTYTCTWGQPLQLASGDVITSQGPINIVSENGINVSNVTFGGNGNDITLRAGGSNLIQLNNSTLFGSITNTPRALLENGTVVHGTISTSSTVTVNNSTVNGSVTSGAALNANGAIFNSSVNSNSSLSIDNSTVAGTTSSANAFTASNTTFGNNVISNGSLTITNGNVNGNIQAANALNLTSVNVTGTTTSTNGLINIVGGDYTGLVLSNCCKVTVSSGATIRDGITAGNNGIEISDSTVSGNLTAANNPIVLNNVNMLSGNISAGQNNVTINGGIINANIPNAHRIFVNNNAQVNGNLQARYEVNLNSSVVVGNVETTDDHDGLHHVYMTDSIVYGNVIVRSDWGTITGNWPNSAIYGDCQYNSVTPNLCSEAPPEFCDEITTATGFGIVGLSGFDYKNSTINNQTIRGEGNTPTPVGVVDTVNLNLPPLDPAVFPTFTSSTNVSGNTIIPGTYNQVTPNNNGTLTSGTYYIKRLTIGNNSTLTMQAGDYFIEDFRIGNGIQIITSGGAVNIFIKNSIESAQGGSPNQVEINTNGNVSNFRVYLYDGASIDIGNGNQGNNAPVNFNGLIYGPAANNNISFGNNNTIQGSILVGGVIDVGTGTEFIYSAEVESQINAAYGCDPDIAELHHYRIRHPSGIVSCFSAPVIVDACADASCSTLYQDPVSVSLASTAAGSNWQGGDLTSTSGTSGTLALSSGTGVAGLRNVPGGTTTLSISSATVPAENSVQCFDPTGSTPTSCQVNFHTAGLIFTAANGSSPISDQFAGSPFDVALRAVETNTTTGACEARVEGPQTVNIGVECLNPADCIAGQAYTIDGTEVGFNSNGVVNNLLPVNVTFDATGTATLPHNYTDVGLLRLHGSLTLAPEPNADNPDITDPPVTLSGTSTTEFVVKPYSLVVSALDDDNNIWTATTDSGPGYRAAGEEFTVIVQSLNANGDPTPNFGNETPIVDVSASVGSVVFPAGGELGQLNGLGGFQLSPTIEGAFTNNGLTWSEVGTLGLVASLVGDDYLGGGDAFERPVSPVGRFYPDRFVVADSSVVNACTVDGFSYMGQPDILVDFTLHAVNTNGNRTENYGRGGYLGSAEVNGVIASLTPLDSLADEFNTRFGFNAASLWEDGILTFVEDSIVFNRRADDTPDGPYPEARVGLQISDELDNRGFSASTATLSTVSGDAAPLSGTLNLVYGRMVLENTFGPEEQPLPVDLRTQIWNGDNFVVHTNDSCSTYAVANLLLLDSGATTATADGTDGLFEQGFVPLGDLVWLPPTVSGSFDEFEFEYDAPAWLEFDWVDVENNTHRDPRAFASFGQYRGNDRIIFWLELR